MSRNKRIDGIYKILPLYEAMSNDGNNLFADSYVGYLRHIYVEASGWGIREIPDLIKGLIALGNFVEHKYVRQTVLHMISLIEKEDDDGDRL